METWILEMLAEWGPWGIVALLLWRCIERQSQREDRLAEVIRDNAAMLEKLTAALERGQK